MRSLDEAESQVRKNESRLSEDDTVPADAAAIQSLRDQLGVRDTTTSQRLLHAVKVLHPCAGSSPSRLSPEVAGRAGRARRRLPGSAVGSGPGQRGGLPAQQAPPRPQLRAGALPGEGQSDGRQVERSEETDGDTVSSTGGRGEETSRSMYTSEGGA